LHKIDAYTQQKAIYATDNYRQAGDLYLSFSEADRAEIIINMTADLTVVRDHKVQVEMISHFYKANTEYGTRLAKALHIDVQEVANA
jgi:catalase